MLLTIAIPTYNRADQLEHTLNLLIGNIHDGVTILVLDNASTDNTQQILERFKSGPLAGKIKCMRNSSNIGMYGNLMRCFELADSEWLWILGDDDYPDPEASRNILGAIDEFPNADFFNFATGVLDSRVRRKESYVTIGLPEMIKELDCCSNLIFISASVYRVGVFLRYLYRAYEYNHTMIPHIALLLLQLCDNPTAICVFSDKRTVHWEPGLASWSYERYCTNSIFILELLPSLELRRLLFEKMNHTDPLAPSFSLRSVHQASLANDNLSANYFKRYASISSLMGAYNRPLVISYFFSRLLYSRPFKQLLNGLVVASKKPIPLLGRHITRLLDLELGVPRPSG